MARSLMVTSQPVAPIQASSDAMAIALWLRSKGSHHTQRAYSADVERFLAFTGKPLHQVTLGDLQAFADTLHSLAPASRVRTLAAVKSLLGFTHKRIGYLAFDVGGAFTLPSLKDRLAERILPEADVQRMLALEVNARNRALLRLLYAGGLRVSEVCALKGKDLQAREEAGQVNVFGKGEKTRAILLPASVWRELSALRVSPEAPVFPSQRGGHLDSSQVLRIVRVAARRAGLSENVSPHWLRHAHASHALDRGCPISLVQATLGHSSVATTGRYLHARPTDSSARYLAV